MQTVCKTNAQKLSRKKRQKLGLPKQCLQNKGRTSIHIMGSGAEEQNNCRQNTKGYNASNTGQTRGEMPKTQTQPKVTGRNTCLPLAICFLSSLNHCILAQVFAFEEHKVAVQILGPLPSNLGVLKAYCAFWHLGSAFEPSNCFFSSLLRSIPLLLQHFSMIRSLHNIGHFMHSYSLTL